MKSAFGVDHVDVIFKKDKERAEHYGRMSGITGTLGATAGTVGAGSFVVGQAERKGKDPMGFTARGYGERALSSKAKLRALQPYAKAHAWQAKTLGGIGAAGAGLSAAYKHQKKKELSKREKRTFKQKSVDTGLAAGSAGVGGAALVGGGRMAHVLNGQAKDAGAEARASHHTLAGEKLGVWDLHPEEKAWHKANRRLGVRVGAVKRPAALATAAAGAAGGAGLYELARHGTRKLRKKTQ